ncbi:redox-sensing transcriptional repressor Rex [Halocella sp. SP3-1]|uniref:redox-sensing transcriptional repressor Rex n=1 Tax=Halocella sp. SP3-1 TaxID=2382161 RepID=UPI000F74F04B|nr:redox-sensing transcriptional repressor Rex [Halocella sp. SP3-1]AZO96228.1 redox-sensing transcriptional repressor Rex [Halocella sp. SP3-1]
MKGIPQPTIHRLVAYYRHLKRLAGNNDQTVICSKKLGHDVGTSSAQVRKDLSYFGEFGCKGVGYDIHGLKKSLEVILGLNRSWPVVLIGAGNLGRALINYQEFKKMRLEIVEVFDYDLDKIGNNVGNLVVKNVKNLDSIISRGIQIGILAVPVEEAQGVAERLVKVGIKAIWNFAPTPLNLPPDVIIYHEDLSSSLVGLVFYINQLETKVIKNL